MICCSEKVIEAYNGKGTEGMNRILSMCHAMPRVAANGMPLPCHAESGCKWHASPGKRICHLRRVYTGLHSDKRVQTHSRSDTFAVLSNLT